MANKKSTKSSKKQTTNKKSSLPFVKAKIDQLCNYGEGSSLRAYASASIDNTFAVHGLRVYQGESGLFVTMPSRKIGEEYSDTFHAISKEGYDILQKAVVSAYDQAIKESQEKELQNGENNEDQSESSEEDHSMRQTM